MQDNVINLPYIEQQPGLGRFCLMCEDLIPCGGPLICDSCRELWKELKAKKIEVVDRPCTDDIITELFNDLGVPYSGIGRMALRYAVNYVLDDPSYLRGGICKRLYPDIAKVLKSTPSRIERAIRYTISVAFTRGNTNVLDAVFGYSVDDNKGMATNMEFIAACVAQIKRRKGER